MGRYKGKTSVFPACPSSHIVAMGLIRGGEEKDASGQAAYPDSVAASGSGQMMVPRDDFRP
jgi:hypothetical protein